MTSRASEHLHRVMHGLFDKQREVVQDPSKRIAIFGTRRMGKTALIAPWIVQEAVRCPDNEATIFFIGPTIDHAKGLLWRPMENLNKQYDLGLHMRNDPARIFFPNGVHLYFRGAKDKEQLGVLRGFKLLNVFVDELQEIRDELVSDILSACGPGLRDLSGRFVFSGTPGRIPLGHWYDITTGAEENWSVHQWSLFDNPFLTDDAKNIDLILQEEGLTVECPRFKREYMGLWVEDGDDMVYRWALEKNGVVGEPVLDPAVRWHYVMGIDFGHKDDSACVVGAFSFDSDQYYEVAESGGPELSLSDFMTNHVMPLIARYDPMRIVADPQAKQLVAEINQRWQLGMQKADKAGKLAYIEVMNSDFILGRIHTPVHFKLTHERQRLVWDPSAKPKLEEHPRRPNHYCDAALYAYREAKHWIGKTFKAERKFASESERDAFLLKEYIRKQANQTDDVLSDWANDNDFY